jgi:hypothetical protein
LATQLSIYNGALLLCKERFLATITDNVEARYLLDFVWGGEGTNAGINACLERGQWNFAMRTIQQDYDPSIEPQFGYRRTFDKPSDWVLTSAIGEEEYFRVPLTRYFDEAGYWYADLDMIYVRYVSDDPNYGGNLAAWPPAFTEFVEAYFARRIIAQLTKSDEDEARLEKYEAKKLLIAKSRAAMADPTRFTAQGAWSRSRQRFLNRRDGGNTGNLIG